MRHAWCNMNSSKGLQVEPNVVPVFGALGGAEANELDDRFLTFQAIQDIQPFERELLWDYDWEKSGAPAEAPGQETPLQLEARGPGQEDPDTGTMDETPKTVRKAKGKAKKRSSPGVDEEPADDVDAPGSEKKGPQQKKARVSAGGEPGEAGSLPADGSEAQQRIRATGRPLGRTKALEVFFHEGQVKVVFERKAPKKLPTTIVYNVHGDSCRSTNEWTRIPYHLTTTTQIFLADTDKPEKKVKVSAVLAGDVHVEHVWGYEDQGGREKGLKISLKKPMFSFRNDFRSAHAFIF